MYFIHFIHDVKSVSYYTAQYFALINNIIIYIIKSIQIKRDSDIAGFYINHVNLFDKLG